MTGGRTALALLVIAFGPGCSPGCAGSTVGPGDADADADGDDGGDRDSDSDADLPDADRDTDEDGGPHGPPDAEINPDAFWADDPPPAYCGPEDRAPPEPPGGTPECPDDKNREGCPCDVAEGEGACWPGLRVDRNRGICHDGIAQCSPVDEFGYGRWGPCEGYVLPVEGATRGAEACNCFSRGRWDIDNLSPCFVTRSDGAVAAVSTYLDGGGAAHCPSGDSWPPEPEPGHPFSPNRLLVDCSGQFRLCLTLRAGDSEDRLATDCILAQVCTESWYDEPADGAPREPTELPALDPWASSDTACVRRFMNEGGYAEMSVVGLSIECEEIGTDEEPYVFNVVTYCPLYCNDPGSEELPECERCGNGASGEF